MEYYDKIKEAVAAVRRILMPTTRIAIVLGTGLSKLGDELEDPQTLNFSQIPHMPGTTVESHQGKLISGKLGGVPVICQSGRFHYYEGYDMKEVTLPIRIYQLLGIRHLLLSNAAGATHERLRTGDLVMVRDHINLHVENPLRGINDERLGPRFPDMSVPYDPATIEEAIRLGNEMGIKVKKGTYVSSQGPNLETPAEYAYIHRIGGDLAGMSTTPEVITARHGGMKVNVLSVVTNECYPPGRVVETSLDDVVDAAAKASPGMIRLVKALMVFMNG